MYSLVRFPLASTQDARVGSAMLYLFKERGGENSGVGGSSVLVLLVFFCMVGMLCTVSIERNLTLVIDELQFRAGGGCGGLMNGLVSSAGCGGGGGSTPLLTNVFGGTGGIGKT